MKNVRMTIGAMVVVCVCCFGLPKAMGDILFDDGQTHNIDWSINDGVLINDSFAGDKTTVNLLTSGSIEGYLYANDSSQVTISGGTLGSYLGAFNNSQVTISGGTVGGQVFTRNNSQVTISGGSIEGHLVGQGSGQITISGGSIGDRLYVQDNSQVTISGGSIANQVNVFSQLTMSGGSIEDSLVASTSGITNGQVTISGGSIEGYLVAVDSSQVTISGGSIGADIYAGVNAGGGLYDNATIRIAGVNFAINGTSVGYGEYDNMGQGEFHGLLTGILANGDLINNEFYINGHSSIVLEVPEPCSLVLLSLGGLMLRRRRAL